MKGLLLASPFGVLLGFHPIVSIEHPPLPDQRKDIVIIDLTGR